MLSKNKNTSFVVSNDCCHGNDCIFSIKATIVQEAAKGERKEQKRCEPISNNRTLDIQEFFTTSSQR